MLNLIPAILLLLAGGPFGPSSGDAVARIESTAHKALVVQLARELERAGLSAAQAVLVMASCEEEAPENAPAVSLARLVVPTEPAAIRPGFDRAVRSRDGPRLG